MFLAVLLWAAFRFESGKGHAFLLLLALLLLGRLVE
jgi:integral membrane sensor domain MASE1